MSDYVMYKWTNKMESKTYNANTVKTKDSMN